MKAQINLFDWEIVKPIRAIDDRTLYDVPHKMEKLAQSMSKEFPLGVTDAVIGIRYRHGDGSLRLAGYHFGNSNKESAIVMADCLKLKMLGVL